MELARRESVSHPVEITMKLNVMTAVEEVRVDFRRDILEADFGLILDRRRPLNTISVLKRAKGIPASFWNGLKVLS